MARNWTNLSDYEFEQLVGDLIGEDQGCRFERFTRGPDSGIDLRHIPSDRRSPEIVQAKHYPNSTFATLRSAVKREAKQLRKTQLSVSSYRLVTSRGLTPGNKATLASELDPWITRDDQVLGRDDLEQMLDRHPVVERRHIKLWLGSSTQLRSLLQPGTHARSRVLAQEVVRALPLYVQGGNFTHAADRLRRERVLVIAGPPGIGKTTLARMLVGDAVAQGYEPIEVSQDISEAWQTWDRDSRQIFLYDDFLGRTMLGALSKNEDSRLLSFMHEVADSPHSLLVLTTREYILQEADRTYEAFRRHGLVLNRFVLSLPSYTPIERALILHNHVWHSELPLSAKRELVVDRGYREIVAHEGFNPRLIEYITGLQRGHPVSVSARESWLGFAVDALDHPDEIWRQAFERELGEAERQLLLCLTTMPDEAEIGDLERAFATWAENAGLPAQPNRFEGAMKVVDDSFTASRAREGKVVFVTAANPGLLDFLSRQLAASPETLTLAARSAVFFEQVQKLHQIVDFGSPATVTAVIQAQDLSDAIARVIEGRGTRWILVKYWSGPGEYQRVDQSADERLAWLLSVAGWTNPPCGARELVARVLADRIERWQRRHGDSRPAAGLAHILASDEAPVPAPDGWAEALVDMALYQAGSDEDWQGVAEMMETLPDVFTQDLRERAIGEFLGYANSVLAEFGEDTGSEEEVDALRDVAAALGTELDEDEVERAIERIQDRLGREDYDAAEDRGWGDRYNPSRLGETVEMDAIFGRLLED